MNLSLDGVRTLFLVLEHGSLSRAAGVLGVPVSTVSRRVSDLEASLGREILTRSGRGVAALRDAGETLARLRDVLDAVDAVHAGGGQEPPPLSTLRLTAPLEMSLRVIPDVASGAVRRVGGLVLPGMAVHALYPRRHRKQPVVRDVVVAVRAGLESAEASGLREGARD
jgi:DNA-binding transcriptional LysR family regulator